MDNSIADNHPINVVELRARALAVTSTLREWGVTPLCDFQKLVEMGEQILANPSGPVDIRRFVPGRMLLQLLTDWTEQETDDWAYYLDGQFLPWRFRGKGFIATTCLALFGPYAEKRLGAIGKDLIEIPNWSFPDTCGDRVKVKDMSLRELTSVALQVQAGDEVAFFDLRLASALMSLQFPIMELIKVPCRPMPNGVPIVVEPRVLAFRKDQEGPPMAILMCLNTGAPS